MQIDFIGLFIFAIILLGALSLISKLIPKEGRSESKKEPYYPLTKTSELVTCHYCGAKITGVGDYCPVCGNQIRE
jgi:hypothetical protein